MDYEVGLFALRHRLAFDDVAGKVSISFPDFDSVACGRSHDPGIYTVCSNLTNFYWAGVIYAAL
jgi:hypothetical protein